MVKKAPKSDILVLLVTFVLTVVFDLVIAIEVGIVISAFLFMKRMADETRIKSWKYADNERDETENDKDSIALKAVPKHTLVYEINGPLFFAATEQFMNITTEPKLCSIILRMRSVPAMDITALDSLQKVHDRCVKNNITLIFSHVQSQPMEMMKKAGFHNAVGMENFCPNIDAALERASLLLAERQS
jgi:SulP family sulfate permease